MGAIVRGVKNVFRNNVRSFAVVCILAVSIGMALIMFMALQSVNNRIAEVKSSIGNTLTVSPAGVRGFQGGGTLLTDQNATDIQSMTHVTSIIETLSGRLTTIGSSTGNLFGRGGNSGSNTNNQTSLSAPSVQAPSNSSGSSSGQRKFFINGQDVTGQNFSLPITATGISDLSSLFALNATSFTVTAGEKIDPTSSDNVAMIGKGLADQNKVSAGGTFTAYGQTITVKGVFDAGNTFANNAIIFPIKTLQNLSGEAGQIDSIIVTADSIDNVASVQTAIQNKLGSAVDVTTAQDQSNQAIQPLENIKTISTYSLIGALIAGAVVIFLIMVMIVRERRREIGVLKAIGASNISVTMQFVSEALALTIASSIVGIIGGVALSNPMLKVLVSSGSQAAASSGGGRGAGRFFSAGLGQIQSAITNLHSVVSPTVILYGLGAAVVIAIIGSSVPAFLISKIRPAEVMRTE